MSKRPRRKHSPVFKAKVELAALTEQSLAQLTEDCSAIDSFGSPSRPCHLGFDPARGDQSLGSRITRRRFGMTCSFSNRKTARRFGFQKLLSLRSLTLCVPVLAVEVRQKQIVDSKNQLSQLP